MAPSPSFTTDPAAAAQALFAGGVVAIPSETVYGLGALATDTDAVARVFQIKGRPSSNPLIVHIRGAQDVRTWTSDVPAYLESVLAHFWPGPLTVVVPARSNVPDIVRAGAPTVALRSPAHPVFQAVLRHLTGMGIESPGIAAPSANRSGRVSPTSAQDVAAELGDRLTAGDIILEGGRSQVGVESTIVICQPAGMRIARLGSVTQGELAEYAPTTVMTDHAQELPGTAAAHYSPTARVHLVDDPTSTATLVELTPSNGVGVIGLRSDVADAPSHWRRLTNAEDPPQLAHQLYASLREADLAGLTDVVAIAPAGGGIAAAIRDRLSRAAQG